MSIGRHATFHSSASCAGITLTEILVAITFITLFAFLTVPDFYHLRKETAQTECASAVLACSQQVHAVYARKKVTLTGERILVSDILPARTPRRVFVCPETGQPYYYNAGTKKVFCPYHNNES